MPPTDSVPTRNRLPVSVRIGAAIAIGAILGTTFLAYFVFQSSAEDSIRSAIFEQQKERQLQFARSLSFNIESDLQLLMSKLDAVASSVSVQAGDLTGANTDRVLEELYAEANEITDIQGVFIIDKDNKVANYIDPSVAQPGIIGYDTSTLPTVIEYRNNMPAPTFGKAYKSTTDGTLRFAMYHPIYSERTGEHMGAVSMSVSVGSFFRQYGNIDSTDSQYLAALDSDATILVTPFKDIVGLSVYDETVQATTPPEAYEHYQIAMGGQESIKVFNFRTGERINIGEPIILNGKPTYSVFVVTPTASIYAQVDSILAIQRTESYLLHAAIAAAVGVALFFLLRWSSSLEKRVAERTRDLQEANRRLEDHDRMQREFINIAAHELRTPIQPMLGITEIIKSRLNGQDSVQVDRADIELLERNANRLERLSSQLLEAARIEGGSIKLNLEQINISEKVKNVIANAKSSLQKGIAINYVEPEMPLVVRGDKIRLFEVLSNLLSNAIKFTNQGSITISAQQSSDGKQALVKVADTGMGIDPDVMPRLFEKFVTKSDTGTGIGLFLAKNIIEAHGGKIWAENNPSGGATFSFTLPLAEIGHVPTTSDTRQFRHPSST